MSDMGFLCYSSSHILVVVYFIACFIPLMFTGALFSEKVVDAGYCSKKLASLACFAIISVFGYIAAWCFLAHMILGNIFVTGFFIYSIYMLYQKEQRDRVKLFIKDADIFIPLVLTFLIGLYYIAISYGDVYPNVIGDKYDKNNVEIVNTDGAPDYLIQFKWMKYMIRGNSPWHKVLDPEIGKTTVADRPPLMAGITSLYYSPSLLLKPLFSKSCRSNLDLYYFMAVTTLLSLMWIAAAWGLLRTIGFSHQKTILSIFCLAHVYFLFFSSVFTWPKSFAGSFVIGVFTLLIAKPIYEDTKIDEKSVVTASVFAGLAAFAHFSVVIPCFAIACLLLLPRLFPGMRNVLIGSGIFLLIAMPYLLLTSIQEGSNKLTRYTMTTPDLKTLPDEYQDLSTIQAVKQAYSQVSKQEVLDNKIYNVKTIFSGPLIQTDFSIKPEGLITNPIIQSILGSVNILNLCWFLFIPGLSLLGICFCRRTEHITIYGLIVAFSSLFILAMINFKQPVMNINNIAPTFLIILALSIRAFSLPKWFYTTITILNIAYFYKYLWYRHVTGDIDFNYIMLPIYVLALVGIVMIYKKDTVSGQ